ncbi:MAG TPA: hypothetical protein VM638_02520 [Actinomycetota bacterium]|nr:hypothetical protein [Actinomycetota bacterium]
MALIVIILLIWAAVSGVLWQVLRVAAGVALGIFFAGFLLIALVTWAARRKLRRWTGGPFRRR